MADTTEQLGKDKQTCLKKVANFFKNLLTNQTKYDIIYTVEGTPQQKERKNYDST